MKCIAGHDEIVGEHDMRVEALPEVVFVCDEWVEDA